jgi:flagellar biosynthesis/type III secretory pathway protein FliH
MNEQEFEARIKALQQDVTKAYLAGYNEARDRAQHTVKAAIDESERLRRALEEALAHVDETARVRILAAMLRGKSASPESSQEPYRQNRDE